MKRRKKGRQDKEKKTRKNVGRDRCGKETATKHAREGNWSERVAKKHAREVVLSEKWLQRSLEQ